MQIINYAVKKPKAVLALVLVIVLLGLLSLLKIPIQLTPDINRPVIQLSTFWPNSAPIEIEREITNQQEEELQGLEGLYEMTSTSSSNVSQITLEFDVQQNMDRALILVNNRLSRVESYPNNVDQPLIQTAGNEDNPIAWMVLKNTKNDTELMHKYGDLAEDVIKNRLERIPGLARVNVFGGSELELQVLTTASEMAKYGLTLVDVLELLNNANISITGGDIDEGKRKYLVRTEADFSTLKQVENVVIKVIEQPDGNIQRVTVGDVAKVQFGYKEPQATIRHLGQPTLAMNAIREYKSNVITVMAELKKAIAELNENELEPRGLQLYQVYDETVYINSAIDLVQMNIIIGGILAAGILYLFLRSKRATIVISLAIPVSVIGAFVAMAAFGRSLNVISLAGIAFAVGMVVDAAIVVLENIYRHYQMGKDIKAAAITGAKEVWGAIFVSVMTTVAAFVPILFMELEAGQLFRDIIVAITVAVFLSLLVAITVVPALFIRFFVKKDKLVDNKFFQKLDKLGSRVKILSTDYVEYIFDNPKEKKIIIASILLVCFGLIFILMPKLEYLPEGNRNLAFGVILPPPGYNLEATTNIAKNLEKATEKLWQPDESKFTPWLPGGGIKNFFFVALNNVVYVGAAATSPSRVKELIPILTGAVFQNPGTYGFISQSSLFGRNIGSGRSIDLDFSGANLEEILNMARQALFKLEQVLPRAEGNQFRPIPGLELGAPEVRVLPDPIKISDVGLTNRDIALTVRALNDGLRVSEITVADKRMDLTLRGPEKDSEYIQDVNMLPITTRKGDIVPLENLAKIEYTAGPTEIRHKDAKRTVTLQIRPQERLPLETAIDIVEKQIVADFKEEAKAKNISIRLAGTADKLSQTWDELKYELLFAMLIVYMFMAIFFENFIYPAVVMLTVPAALAGGMLGLWLLNLFSYQPLDMLTMLGFVILIGIIVNNAILIVHYAKINLAQNVPLKNAVLLATQTRLRPIFMSTLTSLFGMLPLVLFPGAGSELYRGLGSVVLGGLALSAVITLAVVPALLSFLKDSK